MDIKVVKLDLGAPFPHIKAQIDALTGEELAPLLASLTELAHGVDQAGKYVLARMFALAAQEGEQRQGQQLWDQAVAGQGGKVGKA